MDPSPFARKSALQRSPVAAKSIPPTHNFDFTPLHQMDEQTKKSSEESAAATAVNESSASATASDGDSAAVESRPKPAVKRLVPKPRFTASAATAAIDAANGETRSAENMPVAIVADTNTASSVDPTTSSQPTPAPRVRPPFPVAIVKRPVSSSSSTLTKKVIERLSDTTDIIDWDAPAPARVRSNTSFVPSSSSRSIEPPTRNGIAASTTSASSLTSSSSADSSNDELARIDISDKITDALLSRLADDQWKLRAAAMEEIHSMLNAAKHRITLTRDGGLFETLKLRLVDNNKNLARDALILLQRLTTDLGQPIVRHHQKLIPPILVSIGDSKTFVRTEAQKCLEQMIDLGGLQLIIKYLPKTLEPTHVGRKEILELLSQRLPSGPQRSLDGVAKFDVNELILPVLNLCVDKQGDVRSAAEKVLEYMIGHVGYEPVLEQTKEMKKALVLQIMPMMEKCRSSAAAANSLAAAATASATDKSLPTSSHDDESTGRPSTAPAKKSTLKKPVTASSNVTTSASGASTARAATSTTQTSAPSSHDVTPPSDDVPTKAKTFLKAKSRQSTLPAAIKSKPAGTNAAASTNPTTAQPDDSDDDDFIPPPPSTQTHGILKKPADQVAKRTRIQKESKRIGRGVYRELSKDEMDELDASLSSLLVDDLYQQLMHKDFQKQVSGLEWIEKELNDTTNASAGYESVSSVSDLLLKYFAYRLCGDANSVVLGKILTILLKLFSLHESTSYKLSEVEAASILPTLVEKSLGHNTARFRNDTHNILLTHCAALHPMPKIMNYILQGYDSKNKRVQCECLELSGTVLSKNGLSGSASVCDVRKVIPLIGNLVGASDGGIRTAALNALSTIYSVSGEELWTLLGRGLSKDKQLIPQKSIAMIEQRFKGIKAGTGINVSTDDEVPQSAPILTTQTSATSSGIPAPSISAGTPRKSMMPVPPSSTVLAATSTTTTNVPALLKKKSAIATSSGTNTVAATSTSAATPSIRPRSQTLRASHFASAKSEYEDESFNEPPPSKPLMTHTPIKAAGTEKQMNQHTRFHSAGEVEQFEDLAEELLPTSISSNLPGCFSLDVDVDATSGTTTPSRLAFQSPARLDHTNPANVASGVAQSSLLSDTLLVLMEPTIPTGERVEALQRMEQLIASQGKRAIAYGDEESLVEVLLQELANSFVVYATTGLVTVQPVYNASSLAAIRALVTSVDIMELMPQQLTAHLLEFLFTQLSDQRILRSPACTNLVRECDRIILRALECMPRTRAFCTVIEVLQAAMTTPSCKLQIPIIAKCLSKLLTAYVKNGSTPKLDLDEILSVLKHFTDVISPADTTHDNDAMKAVLSVLHEVVASRAPEVRLIFRSVDTQSVLYQYAMQLISSEESTPNRTPTQSPPPSQQHYNQPQPQQQQVTPQGRVRSNTLHGNTGIPMPSSISSVSSSNSSASTSASIPISSPTATSVSSIPSASMNSTPQPYEGGRGRAMTTTVSPAGTPSSYREQLELLKAKAASFTTSPIAPSQSTTNVSTPTHADSSAFSSSSSSSGLPSSSSFNNGVVAPKPTSSLEAIRARFKMTKPIDENGTNSNGVNTSTPATTTSTATTGSSSLLALRAKVATMNNKLAK